MLKKRHEHVKTCISMRPRFVTHASSLAGDKHGWQISSHDLLIKNLHGCLGQAPAAAVRPNEGDPKGHPGQPHAEDEHQRSLAAAAPAACPDCCAAAARGQLYCLLLPTWTAQQATATADVWWLHLTEMSYAFSRNTQRVQNTSDPLSANLCALAIVAGGTEPG